MQPAETKQGRIAKVVHVGVEAAAGTDSGECHGYGIVRGDDGQELFFVDSAVHEARFRDLTVGQRVAYLVEQGPLSRANKVIQIS